MFKRPFFWFGLLFGGLFAFGTLKRRPRKSLTALTEWADLTGDAFVACDKNGEITGINAAAQALFGPSGIGLANLCYSNGQAVPPGQLPFSRVLQANKRMMSAAYLGTATDGSIRTLDVAARPLPNGGAAAVFHDVTAHHQSQTREIRTQAQIGTLQNLCRRLSGAATMEAIGRAVVEEACFLLALPNMQVRLYWYDPAAQMLTRLASEPEDRPKHPKSAAQVLLPTFRFDASVPALWQLYVARQPTESCLTALGEELSASAYAVPLLSGGIATGHLSFSSPSACDFDDPNFRALLELLASQAALALAGPQRNAASAKWQAQADAVQEITQAIAKGLERGILADLIIGHIRKITGCEVCTLSVPIGETLTVLGEAFREDLLFPEHITRTEKTLHGKAVQKAWRTQKMTAQLSLANPQFEIGPWRAFAGQSGRHSVFALPLEAHLGVLAVYTGEAAPLPDIQVKFLETAAALFVLALRPASVPVDHADC